VGEHETADALRRAAKLDSPRRLPTAGDIVQVYKTDLTRDDSGLGICTEYHKGWCLIRALDDEGELTRWLDFISDEARHGPSKAEWRIRDDLRNNPESTQETFDVSTMTEQVRDTQAVEEIAKTLFAQVEGDARDEAWQRCPFKPIFRKAARVAMVDLQGSFDEEND
jgi:hypothetical protein